MKATSSLAIHRLLKHVVRLPKLECRLKAVGQPVSAPGLKLCQLNKSRYFCDAVNGVERSSQQRSFIDIAREEGIDALLGPFPHKGGFDSCLKKMTIEKFGKDYVQCHIPVTASIQNSYGTLHGGAITTIIDVVGTLALLTKDHARAGVSIEINSCFLTPSSADDVVIVNGRVMKYGKKLGFADVELFSRTTGKRVATGRHTKFFTK